MTEGWIFDFGGTIDTDGCHWGQMLWHAYERLGMGVKERHFRDAYVYGERALERNPLIKSEYSFRKTLEIKLRLELENLCLTGRWNADERAFQATQQRLADDLYQRTQATIARNAAILRQIKRGKPMALVTNFYGNMPTVLEEFGLTDLFDHVIESAAVGIRKPDQRIFRLAIDALGLPAEQIVSVGDSFYKDIEPSKQLGCKTVWLKGEGWTAKRYDENFPDKVVTSLAELPTLVL